MILSPNIRALVCVFIFLTLASGCTSTLKVKDGDTAFDLRQYAVAVELLETEYTKARDNKEKARKAYRLALSNQYLLHADEELKWFDLADQLGYGRAATRGLAYALKKNERYNEAIAVFTELNRFDNDAKIADEIRFCRFALNEAPNDEWIIRSSPVNTPFSEYSPVYFEDEFIVFTSDRDSGFGEATYNWTGNYFSDLFIVSKRGNSVHTFDAIINTEGNEGAACFTRDYSEIFFTRCTAIEGRDDYCRIYWSSRSGGYWSDPAPLDFFSEDVNFGQPALVENDSVMIFSALADKSINTYDLYYSVKVEGGWSEPYLMPSSINTVGNEKFPTGHGNVLYFASDFLPGYGGFDIFKTTLQPDGSWSSPENLGKPVNSGFDDFGYALDPDLDRQDGLIDKGIFTSSRNQGMGDDLFVFERYASDESEEIEAEVPVVPDASDVTLYLAGIVVELVYEDDDPNMPVESKIKIPGAKVTISSDTTIHLTANEDGRFLVTIDRDKTYTIKAEQEGYLTRTEKLTSSDFPAGEEFYTYNVELPLSKIYYDKEIILNNIYYDFDKWDIREDARPSLDSLSAILVANPALNIQLASHTDCRGEDMYNLELSQKRAQSAVGYLIDSGISPARLSAKGFGESMLAVNCDCSKCTEEEHQVNRRTTFKILKK